MTSVAYHGHVPMTYPHYIDLTTGKTLVCQPGRCYDIAPASGSPLSAAAGTPNDGRFEILPREDGRKKKAKDAIPDRE